MRGTHSILNNQYTTSVGRYDLFTDHTRSNLFKLIMPSINTSAVAGNLSSASHDSSTTAATSAATTNRGARITASVDEIIARISAKHKVYGFIIIDPIHHKIIKNDLISSDDRALFVKRKSSNNDTTGINEEQGDEDNNTVSIEEYAEMCINFVKAAEKFTEHFFEQDVIYPFIWVLFAF